MTLVKQIQIILDDDEYEELMKVKGERTWKDILMEVLKGSPKEETG